MTGIPLSKVLGRKRELRQALGQLVNGIEPLHILDLDGSLIVGTEPVPQGQRLPVIAEGQTVGWVQGGANAANTAALLSFIAGQESEKKSLAAELLDRYRELHLLYNLSEHLAVSPLPEEIAGAALQEVMRLIRADSGLILLNREGHAGYESVAARGNSQPLISNCCVIERVLETGKAELANAVPGREYFGDMGDSQVSVACAPLTTKDHVLGAVILFGGEDRIFSAGELKLLNTIAHQVAPAIEVSRLHQVALEKARIEHELKMARKVQESLLPAGSPEISGWRFDTRWHPAMEVSGDFYDFIDEGNGRLGLVIADVTGKGMSASLFMVFVRSALRASIDKGLTPMETLVHSNRLVCQDSHEGLFATVFYVRLDTTTGKLTYSNGGHPLPLLVRRGDREILPLRATGLPVGVLIEAIYEEYSLVLQPGDFVLFYTDGVTETFDPQGNEFGEERLIAILDQNRSMEPDQVLTAVEQGVIQFAGGGKASDDLTLLIVRREV